MKCNNIWKLDGECAGRVLHYRVSDLKGGIYDDDTKKLFEKSGFSIRSAFEVKSSIPDEQALITDLCDKHRANLADIHPDWRLKETRPPL
jgi:hypothetical protein